MMKRKSSKIDRRKFLHATALVAGVPAIVPLTASWKVPGTSDDLQVLKEMPLGVIASANNPEEDLRVVRDMGFQTCQLNIADYSPELGKRLSRTLINYQLSPNTLICMGPGKYVWNFIDGPSTIGLVPAQYRAERVERLKQGIDFCEATGIPAVHAHFGFIPENPRDILYSGFVDTMKSVGEYAIKKGTDIYFETGQETPITLRRAIEDIGTGNLFVNYDTANLAMYGKANPLDGLQVLYKYVKAFHAKDGNYPTNPHELGKEVPIPQGEVNFPAIISYLKQKNYRGAIIIECELSDQKRDYIIKIKKYMEGLISSS